MGKMALHFGEIRIRVSCKRVEGKLPGLKARTNRHLIKAYFKKTLNII